MKKLITTAIVAGLLAAPLAAMAEISTYGSLRIGIASTSTTAGQDNATASGLNLRDGASRFGVKGFATPGLSGHIELGVSGAAGAATGANTDIGVRIAKIDYAVTSSSTITVGRTWNPADIHNGWVTGGAEVQASAVGRAHQARTSGVRFNQSLGAIGSFDLMIAVTNEDELAEATAKDTAKTAGNDKSTVTAKSNSIDQSILALTLTPVPDFKITLTYDSLESREEDVDADNILGYGVGYKVGPVLLDLVLTDRSQAADAERSETYYGVSFGTEGQLYYFGYKTVENTNASGVKSDDGETGLTLGADIAFRGGLITVSYNDATNQGGTEGNNENSIGAGFVVNF